MPRVPRIPREKLEIHNGGSTLGGKEKKRKNGEKRKKKRKRSNSHATEFSRVIPRERNSSVSAPTSRNCDIRDWQQSTGSRLFDPPIDRRSKTSFDRLCPMDIVLLAATTPASRCLASSRVASHRVAWNLARWRTIGSFADRSYVRTCLLACSLPASNDACSRGSVIACSPHSTNGNRLITEEIHVEV